jgi:hypothetical protein
MSLDVHAEPAANPIDMQELRPDEELRANDEGAQEICREAYYL